MFNGNGAPYYYDYVNMENAAVTPSTVHVRNTTLQYYFRRYLLQKAMSVFKFVFPETWAENYCKYVLYCWGYFTVFNTDRFGVIPQACGLNGYDVFYRPTTPVVSNPLIASDIRLRIGVNCTLVQLMPNYGNVMDIVNYYADIMALAAEALGGNLLNSKLSYLFTAENKAGAESLKKVYDRVASGEPAVVFDKALLNDHGEPTWQTFSQNVAGNFISPDLLALMRGVETMFDAEIGLPNANTEKKERMIVDEVNANNLSTSSKCTVWLEELQRGFKETREMFGIPESQLSVEWRVKPSELREEEKEDDE